MTKESIIIFLAIIALAFCAYFMKSKVTLPHRQQINELETAAARAFIADTVESLLLSKK